MRANRKGGRVHWLWPQELRDDERITVRIARLIHWWTLGFAVFGLIVTYIELVETGDKEPITYVSVAFLWIALAMMGRGFRYLVARE